MLMFLDHTQTHTLEDSSEWVISLLERPLATQHTTNMRQTTIGFETNVPAIKWLQIYALDCTAIGSGASRVYFKNNWGKEHVIPQVIYVFKKSFHPLLLVPSLVCRQL